MADDNNTYSVKDNATFDTNGGVDFSNKVPEVLGADPRNEIVTTLTSYWNEADNNRKSGMNPRDAKWTENLDLYWNRWDFTKKAAWQAKVGMPEVPGFVDRFAAALKEALIQTPDGFYTVSDPADAEGDMAQAVKDVLDVWLTTAGRNQTGQLLPYSAVFEEQMKLGAIMATASVTTWKQDTPTGRVAVETVDPRMVWLDHTYRNLYRIRRIELDAHELAGMKLQTDSGGQKIFDELEMAKLEGSVYQKPLEDMERTGSGVQTSSARRPVILDEYIATVIGSDGKVLADRALMVMANNRYLIRGPEKNPFWHGKDWMTYTPLVSAPLSVYGRSYMEDFGNIARTFNELTNMLLDAVHTTSLKAFAIVPGMLLNPNQVTEGLSPNKLFLLDDGYKAEDFAKALDLGNLPAESIKMWETLKSELTEAASINEIGLGQFAPNSRTSATEVDQTQQSSSALIRSVAQTVETRFLDPQLDLIWKTGMQHAQMNDKALCAAAGPDMWQAMYANKKEFVKRPYTFQARGISSVISKATQLKALLGVLQVIGQNQSLMQAFMQKVDLEKLIDKIFMLSGVDLSKLTMSDRQKMISGLGQPLQQAQQQAQGAPPASPQGAGQMAQAVSKLGIGR